MGCVLSVELRAEERLVRTNVAWCDSSGLKVVLNDPSVMVSSLRCCL